MAITFIANALLANCDYIEITVTTNVAIKNNRTGKCGVGCHLSASVMSHKWDGNKVAKRIQERLARNERHAEASDIAVLISLASYLARSVSQDYGVKFRFGKEANQLRYNMFALDGPRWACKR